MREFKAKTVGGAPPWESMFSAYSRGGGSLLERATPAANFPSSRGSFKRPETRS